MQGLGVYMYISSNSHAAESSLSSCTFTSGRVWSVLPPKRDRLKAICLPSKWIPDDKDHNGCKIVDVLARSAIPFLSMHDVQFFMRMLAF